ncbi:MAG TPA: rhodanese-like domain-containing protein [Dehalococcoidia bacterium]|nr:rhodanese-like domain-containing protein [Dehalococcoidia bacterium]
MFIEAVKIESLGNTTYVIGSEQSGKAAVVDPVRDVDHYTRIAGDRGVEIVFALETHVHNDFVSGARELAMQTGCEVGASASGGLLYPSRRLQENDELDLGEFRLRVVHTPGHTPEHISFLVIEQDRPTAIFTGGALMPGGAARVDLLGRRIAPFLARWLHHTIHEKLLKLPDEVRVYPTHGGGSFCSASPQSGDGIPSSIGAERAHNPFVERPIASDFVQFALTGLGSYPAYYKYMADINRRGPDVLAGIPRLASLTPLSAWHQLVEGSILIDSREHRLFNQSHVPGAFSVVYGDNFSTWVGWVVPWHTPLVILSGDPATNDGMVRQLIRIGYDRLSGYVSGDLAAWVQAGLPTEGTDSMDVDALQKYRQQAPDALIIDVRQHNEFQSGHIPGSLNIELGELAEHLDGLPRDLPIVVLCASGMRATIAGSILRRNGRDDIRVVEKEGVPQWIARGYASATGAE